jgi:hypothetical protein
MESEIVVETVASNTEKNFIDKVQYTFYYK